MEDFKIIYKILMAFYLSMDYDAFDQSSISPEVLGVSKNKRDALLVMLIERGYISGIHAMPTAAGDKLLHFGKHPQLTLDGLEYLNDNSFMKRAANAIKGIADVVL